MRSSTRSSWQHEAAFYVVLFEGCVAASWLLGGLGVAAVAGAAAAAGIGAVLLAVALG